MTGNELLEKVQSKTTGAGGEFSTEYKNGNSDGKYEGHRQAETIVLDLYRNKRISKYAYERFKNELDKLESEHHRRWVRRFQDDEQ